MKRIAIYLALMVTLFLGLNPESAWAQKEEMETTLARAAAQGFLITLTRPELNDTMEFYLLDSVDSTTILEAIQQTPVRDYQFLEGEWISDVTYQVKAILYPGQREITVYTGKYEGRWQVEGVDLPTATLKVGTMPSASTSTLQPSRKLQIVTATPEDSTPSEGGETTQTSPAQDSLQPVTSNGTGVLVFQTTSGSDIYKINADGTGLQRLTHGIDPQLSPEGDRITFTRWEPQYELFTIDLDGTNEQVWTHGWRQMKSPTWTTDGQQIIFSYQDGGRLNPERVTENLANAAQSDERIEIPSSAVGIEVEYGILKYTIPADAYWFLKAVDLETKQFEDLATERHSYGPSAVPLENKVVYRNNVGVALYDMESNREFSITDDPRDRTPVVSPDGTQIVLSYEQDGHWEVHTLNIDGSNRKRLTSTPLSVLAEKSGLERAEVEGEVRIVPTGNHHWNNAAPTWSPDGSQIAFVTDRTGQWEIWIMNADGSNQRPMFPNSALEGITLNYAGVDERMLSWR